MQESILSLQEDGAATRVPRVYGLRQAMLHSELVDAPPFDYPAVRAYLNDRETRRQAGIQARYEEAWRDFGAITQMIWRVYRPRTIYQWGSLLERSEFSEISDIDIALEGTWEPAVFHRLLLEADAMTRLPLDIVRLDRIHPAFAQGIRRRGRIVHGGA